jgi:hypothetical protein
VNISIDLAEHLDVAFEEIGAQNLAGSDYKNWVFPTNGPAPMPERRRPIVPTRGRSKSATGSEDSG